jgi:hypothetical protein
MTVTVDAAFDGETGLSLAANNNPICDPGLGFAGMDGWKG